MKVRANSVQSRLLLVALAGLVSALAPASTEEIARLQKVMEWKAG